eukprot:TRINITY_DN1328_c2_g1_i2.p1 TRINITY_DN1328_c2_g1~~TRINITY_DN1328_c2_g1_i2.p1  ORF type:complete len:616 (+),score=67.33 TRINITY_DN1328_c2_g1_i2:718-2565(+)
MERRSVLILSLAAALCCLNAVTAKENWFSGTRKPSFGNPTRPWARDYLSPRVTNSYSPRRLAREKIGKEAKISFCQYEPDGPHPNNLLTGKWAVNLSSVAVLTTRKSIAGRITTMARRAAERDGPEMAITNHPAGTYRISGWVKLSSGRHSHVHTTLHIGGQKTKIIATAWGKKECWTKIAGGFTLDAPTDITLKVSGPAKTTNILVSSYSMSVVTNSAWRAAQNKRIDAMRKRAVTLTVVDRAGKPLRVKVTMDQLTSSFPFGAAGTAGLAANKTLYNWHSKRFTVSTPINEMKWYTNEFSKGSLFYGPADSFVGAVEKMGAAVRGHNIFWGRQEYVQPWVQALSKPALVSAMQKRLESVVNRYKGKVMHWDVYNEMLHGHYYQTRVNNSIAAWMYKATRQLDPSVKLFVNDYNVIEYYGDPLSTPETYLTSISNLQAQGAEVDGIGCQGHFVGQTANGPRIKAELDQMAVAGLPIWITELDISDTNPYTQADSFETVMREAFSHPAVQGIVQWEVARLPCEAYYDLAGDCAKPCVTCHVDSNFNSRPIGDRYVRLRKEWSTHVKGHTRSNGVFGFRGFFGDYRIDIQLNGKSRRHYFTVPPGSSPINIRLTYP